MDKQILLLASKMLKIASEQFSNNGNNDLTDDVLGVIDDEKKLCDQLRDWMEDGSWPDNIGQVGDDWLCSFLSDKLAKMLNDSSPEANITKHCTEDFPPVNINYGTEQAVDWLFENLFYKGIDKEDIDEFNVELKSIGITRESIKKDLEDGLKNGVNLDKQLALIEKLWKKMSDNDK